MDNLNGKLKENTAAFSEGGGGFYDGGGFADYDTGGRLGIGDNVNDVFVGEIKLKQD